jgi:hypothetical protein
MPEVNFTEETQVDNRGIQKNPGLRNPIRKTLRTPYGNVHQGDLLPRRLVVFPLEKTRWEK